MTLVLPSPRGGGAGSIRSKANAIRYAIPGALVLLDPGRHHVVEASAGTGKTYLIEHRVVDLLLTTETLIDQILVVTFTEKATSELRFRIRRLLESVHSAAEHSADPDQPHWQIDSDARRRLRDALMMFDRASIYTIHAFCQRILTENAFAQKRLLAQSQIASEEAFDDAFKAALREQFARDERDRLYLGAWCKSGRTVEQLGTLLYRCASQHGRLMPEYDADHATAALERAIHWLPRLVGSRDVARDLRHAGVHANTARAILRRLELLADAVGDFALHRDVATFLVALEAADRDLRGSKARLLPYLVEKLSEAAGSDSSFVPLRDLLIGLDRAIVPLAAVVAQLFLPEVSRRMDEEKSRRGHFDFHDMLRLVWESMEQAGGPEILERLRSRYRYALIDEFQDTDDLQWKIFRKIYLMEAEESAAPEERAPETPEKPGTLCIIGDPKQAIYSFRGADVYTYLQAKRQVQGHGGSVHNLVDNYRSTDDLIRAYNLIFEERFGMAFFTGDIRYDHPVRAATDLRAVDSRGQAIVPVCLFQVTPPDLPPGQKLRAEPLRQALLDRIAVEVQTLLFSPEATICVGAPGAEQPITAGDIFVLTRTVSESNEVASRLRRAGLPCAIYKQEGLFQSREAEEILALLGGIAEPKRRSARFRAWHTRFFGITLSDLPQVSELPDTHPLVARLYEWKALADKLAYEELFARMIRDSGIIERELFLDPSERSLTNFLHIIELLLEDVMRSRCELGELILRLTRWMSETGETDDRNIQRLESERSAVQIMTIHRAKGLEAKVVFVYGGFGSFYGDEVHVYHHAGERLIHIGYPPATIADAVAREGHSEDQRLLYVALTRAVARLYLPYVDANHYPMRGCYAQLNRRLEPLVRQVKDGDAGIRRLYTIDTFPAGASRGHLGRLGFLGHWEPPPSLLSSLESAAQEVEASADSYAEARGSRAGFLVTSYTSMKSQGHSRLPLAAIDFKADIADAGGRLGDDELPGGAQSGVFLHGVLEHVPFASALGLEFEQWCALPEVERVFRHMMIRHNRDPQHLRYSQEAIFRCLTTPIQLGQLGKRSLPQLCSCERILREVEFLYPIPPREEARIAAGIAADSDSIRLSRGYIKGFIDLIVEHKGRVYGIDWKSDILPDYSAGTMARHVYHQYQVQAELYTIALAKMLQITPEDEKQYHRRFGGLLFLFIRGVGLGDESQDRQTGVYYIRPPFDRLTELTAFLSQRDDYR